MSLPEVNQSFLESRVRDLNLSSIDKAILEKDIFLSLMSYMEGSFDPMLTSENKEVGSVFLDQTILPGYNCEQYPAQVYISKTGHNKLLVIFHSSSNVYKNQPRFCQTVLDALFSQLKMRDIGFVYSASTVLSYLSLPWNEWAETTHKQYPEWLHKGPQGSVHFMNCGNLFEMQALAYLRQVVCAATKDTIQWTADNTGMLVDKEGVRMFRDLTSLKTIDRSMAEQDRNAQFEDGFMETQNAMRRGEFLLYQCPVYGDLPMMVQKYALEVYEETVPVKEDGRTISTEILARSLPKTKSFVDEPLLSVLDEPMKCSSISDIHVTGEVCRFNEQNCDSNVLQQSSVCGKVRGYIDFVVKRLDSTPEHIKYEVWDSKLASKVSPKAVQQVVMYSLILNAHLDHLHKTVGGPKVTVCLGGILGSESLNASVFSISKSLERQALRSAALYESFLLTYQPYNPPEAATRGAVKDEYSGVIECVQTDTLHHNLLTRMSKGYSEMLVYLNMRNQYGMAVGIAETSKLRHRPIYLPCTIPEQDWATGLAGYTKKSIYTVYKVVSVGQQELEQCLGRSLAITTVPLVNILPEDALTIKGATHSTQLDTLWDEQKDGKRKVIPVTRDTQSTVVPARGLWALLEEYQGSIPSTHNEEAVTVVEGKHHILDVSERFFGQTIALVIRRQLDEVIQILDSLTPSEQNTVAAWVGLDQVTTWRELIHGNERSALVELLNTLGPAPVLAPSTYFLESMHSQPSFSVTPNTHDTPQYHSIRACVESPLECGDQFFDLESMRNRNQFLVEKSPEECDVSVVAAPIHDKPQCRDVLNYLFGFSYKDPAVEWLRSSEGIVYTDEGCYIKLVDPSDAMLHITLVFDKQGELINQVACGDVVFVKDAIECDVSALKLAECTSRCEEFVIYNVLLHGELICFRSYWGHTDAQEVIIFKQCMRWVEQRSQLYPAMRMYHYSSYERTQLGSLLRFAPEYKLLLRLLYDVLPVVQGSFDVSGKGHSLKIVEHVALDPIATLSSSPYHSYVKRTAIAGAVDSMSEYGRFLQANKQTITTTLDTTSGDTMNKYHMPQDTIQEQDILTEIELYNKADCINLMLLWSHLMKAKLTL